MPPRLVLIIALLNFGAAFAPAPASAQEQLSPSGIACELDPNCQKPPHITTRGLNSKRGITVEGVVPSDKPLSVNMYVNFEFNSAELTSDARITLDRLGAALRDPRLAAYSFVIAGHTDAKGSADYNQRLSERRAASVRSYLIAQGGIAAGRLSSKGYGKTQLLDPDHPEDGVNRRVQVINAIAIAGNQ